MEIIAESKYRFVIPRQGRMRVPGVVFATRALLPDPAGDRALEQVAHVAELPGIVTASYAMPHVHWGVRVPVAVIPCGAGRGGLWDLHGRAELEKLLAGGAAYAVARGHGGQPDLDRCEDGGGAAAGADLAQVSSRAVDRGLHQVGSLGSGNHFLEVQAVDHIFDPAAAEAFGLAEGQVCVMIHCGSHGLGHLICTDHVQIMDQAMDRYGITVPDRQLACAPVSSPEDDRRLSMLQPGTRRSAELTQFPHSTPPHAARPWADLV